MQFIDLKAQQQRIQSELQRRMARVLEHGQYILGPEVFELEENLANFVGSKHCITIANGTDALLVAMMALGIGPGDEVITSPFTFIATAEMIMLLGATPVFVDINPKTYNIDANLIEQAITPRTKLILPVNLYGQCADYDKIDALAKKYKLYTIEDAAQSFGATYKGRSSCTLSDISCTSFFPSKPLGCYGEGGACFTNNDELANIIRQIRNHGQDKRYHHIRVGVNGRLDTLQAAILLVKLSIFPDEVQRRNVIATKYINLLKEHVTTPTVETYNTSVYAQFTVEVNDRDYVVKSLEQRKIPTAVHYPLSLHQQPVINQNYQLQPKLPHAEQAAARVLSLPFHPYLSDADMQQVVTAISESVAISVAA